MRRWPLRKFPVLVDGERNIVETSIIIEYLQLVHPGAVRLIPADALDALDVRFLDRFFDLHVMSPVQYAVTGALTGDSHKRQDGMALAVEKLELAYAWLETHLAGKTWAGGLLRAYRGRLLARPSVARAVYEARPFRPLFPLGAPDRD